MENMRCGICLFDISDSEVKDSDSVEISDIKAIKQNEIEAIEQKNKISFLICFHVFHTSCLETEEFREFMTKFSHERFPQCPTCKQFYQGYIPFKAAKLLAQIIEPRLEIITKKKAIFNQMSQNLQLPCEPPPELVFPVDLSSQLAFNKHLLLSQQNEIFSQLQMDFFLDEWESKWKELVGRWDKNKGQLKILKEVLLTKRNSVNTEIMSRKRIEKNNQHKGISEWTKDLSIWRLNKKLDRIKQEVKELKNFEGINILESPVVSSNSLLSQIAKCFELAKECMVQIDYIKKLLYIEQEIKDKENKLIDDSHKAMKKFGVNWLSFPAKYEFLFAQIKLLESITFQESELRTGSIFYEETKLYEETKQLQESVDITKLSLS